MGKIRKAVFQWIPWLSLKDGKQTEKATTESSPNGENNRIQSVVVCSLVRIGEDKIQGQHRFSSQLHGIGKDSWVHLIG